MLYRFVHCSYHFLLTSIYIFSSFFWNQNRLGFKPIVKIKILDQDIASIKVWKRNKRKPTSQLNQTFYARIRIQIYLTTKKTRTTERNIKLKWKKVSQSGFYPTFRLSCVWSSHMLPTIFCKLQTCSDKVSPCHFPYSSLDVVRLLLYSEFLLKFCFSIHI